MQEATTDRAVAEQGPAGLFEQLYAELQRIADRFLKREPRDHTLMPSAVVHEAFLRMRDHSSIGEASRTRFLAVAGHAMRQVLVDHARRRHADKRGGEWRRVTLCDRIGSTIDGTFEVIALEQALCRLAVRHPRAARIVELRFFGGLDEREVASELAVGRTTVQGDWRFARAWLHRELSAS